MRAALQLGPYTFHERLGEGGSGQVYRATGPDGPVAIKILGPAGDLDVASAARFKREIVALGQVVHPNLVPLLDHGIDDELGPYLVLPLLDGKHLRAAIAGRALCPEAALLVIRPIIAATAALHANGYVHRDLKPENTIITSDGVVTVIDLGLAWREGMTRHTETGAAVGSVGYMAPEQIDGRAVGGAVDVYAIGVMIYEWIVGKRPFARARPAEEAAAVLASSYAKLADADRRVTDELDALVTRCLSADPAKRPTAEELGRAIDAMIDWTDDPDRERARIAADPGAYQATVAPMRVQRAERLARAALDDRKPFVAIGHCDRGLAYAPDHAALVALIAEAERDTTTRSTKTNETDPSASGAISSPKNWHPKRARRAIVLAVAVTALIAAIVIIVLVIPARKPTAPSSDPWDQEMASSNRESVVHLPNEGDKALFRDTLGLLGKAFQMVEKKEAAEEAKRAEQTGEEPATAGGWLARAARQPAAEAVVSIRRALEIDPTNVDAHVRLCVALSAAGSTSEAIAACEAIAQTRPDDIAVLGARAVAYLRGGKLAQALADFDRVVAADTDPRWRRLRAKVRTASGDSVGAHADLKSACELGDAPACSEL